MEAAAEKPNTSSLQSHQYAVGISSSSARRVCDILDRVSHDNIESTLSLSGITLTSDIVHQVLKLSYDTPSSAVVFFRWVGTVMKPTPYAWNLMVDLLGKNGMFESMWDAIRSMKQENVLSMATFASVFGSYCSSGMFKEAVMSFNVMDKYGIHQDVIAVNSLLSAICREDNHTVKAFEFFENIKPTIPPDDDTFAILLEGWEKEGNIEKAKTTFGEMVIRIGWSKSNVPAYDAFLSTLVSGYEVDEALKFLQVMKGKDCLPGLKFFANALDMLSRQNDVVHAVPMWEIMVSSGLVPDLIMYNRMIRLLCDNGDIDDAFRLLDEMVFDGAFPDFLTYTMIFQCLIKKKNVSLLGKFFHEMIKNEFPPTQNDCARAITVLMDGDDPEMAIEIWNYMIENCVFPLDESANALLIGLCKLGRLPEVRRFTEDVLDRRIEIYDSTMSKLKNVFYKEGRSARERFDILWRRWKTF